jgi:hypothetical protein
MQAARPAGEMKNDQYISMVQYARFEFPIEKRHHSAGVELAVPGRFHDLHFINDSGFLINNESINALALKSEVLRFHRIFRVGAEVVSLLNLS